MITAPVNKIIPFSSVDGPGNRTAVFFQGCNWNCKYCHNPETRNYCINCMKCVENCPEGALKSISGKVQFSEKLCKGCDTCISVCPNGASPRILYLTPEETFRRIQKQMPFIRGVTVSGGECSLYCDFITELFSLCKKEGLHTMIDTNASILFEGKTQLLKVTDSMMLDIKAFNEKQHENVTSASNENTLKNARFLAKEGKLYEVRTVVAQGLFDIEDTIRKTGEMLLPYQNISPIRYKLISYRPFGVRKEYRIIESPTEQYMEQLKKIALESGFSDVVTT